MWGYHYHGGQPGEDDHFRHLLKIKPASTLVMDNPGFAVAIKRRMPDCLVVARNNPDGGMDGVFRRMTPMNFMADQIVRIPVDEGIIYYVENEQALTPEFVQWNLKVAQIAVGLGAKVCVLNLSVGNPANMEDVAIARPLLEFAAQHPDNVFIGLHEYCDLHWTSGFNGARGMDGALKDNLPTSIDGYEMYHMGRIWYWIRYCKSIGLKKVRFLITEWGWDLVEQTLFKGQHQCKDRWWQWGISDWETYTADQLLQAKKIIYDPAGDWVAGLHAYCWMPYDHKWKSEDFANMPKFRRHVEQNVYEPEQPPDTGTPPDPVDPPVLEGVPVRVEWIRKLPLNFRSGPGLNYPVIHQLVSGDEVRALSRVEWNGLYGWYWAQLLDGRTGCFALVPGTNVK